jgi:hypothetical protein
MIVAASSDSAKDDSSSHSSTRNVLVDSSSVRSYEQPELLYGLPCQLEQEHCRQSCCPHYETKKQLVDDYCCLLLSMLNFQSSSMSNYCRLSSHGMYPLPLPTTTSVEIFGHSIAHTSTFDDHIVHNNECIHNVHNVVPIPILERTLQNLETLDKHAKSPFNVFAACLLTRRKILFDIILWMMKRTDENRISRVDSIYQEIKPITLGSIDCVGCCLNIEAAIQDQ